MWPLESWNILAVALISKLTEGGWDIEVYPSTVIIAAWPFILTECCYSILYVQIMQETAF